MNPNNPKIQVKKLNFGTISLTTQKASLSTSRNIRIKLSDSIHNTCSNKILPISRNKPPNKLLAFTLNSIRGKYQTQIDTHLNSKTIINSSIVNHKPKNNIPSFTLYSKVSSTSRNKNMTTRLFTITNPSNCSLINVNTMLERSSINTSAFSPSFNGTINTSFQRGSIIQTKLRNKKVVMKPYSTTKEHISLVNRKKQLISQEVENENNKESIENLRKIPFINTFIKRKILFLWIKHFRHVNIQANKAQLAIKLKDDHLILNNQFKKKINQIITIKSQESSLHLKKDIDPHSYEEFFNYYIKQIKERITKMNALKNDSLTSKSKANINKDSNNNNKTLFIKKQSISKLKKTFHTKKTIKTLHKSLSNISSIKKDKEDIILLSMAEFSINNILERIEDKIMKTTFIIEFLFMHNELIQRPSPTELLKPLETIIELFKKERPTLLKIDSKIMYFKKLIEEKYSENIEQQCLFLCYYNDIENYSYEEINSLQSTINHECLLYSYEKAKEALKISFAESIRFKTEDILNQFNQINDSLSISETYTLSNIQIIKYQMGNITKKINQSATISKDDNINKKYNQLQDKINHKSALIKTKYPLHIIRKKIDLIDQSKDYVELIEIITAIMIHQNIQYDKFDTILSNLENYFHHYNSSDSLSKIPLLFNDMTHNKDYDTTIDYFKKTYNNYTSLINSINESSNDFYKQLNLILTFRDNLNDYYQKNKKESNSQLGILFNDFKQYESRINNLLMNFALKVNHMKNETNCSMNNINIKIEEITKRQFMIHLIDNIDTELSFDKLYTKYFKQKLKYYKLIHISFRDIIKVIIDKDFENILSQLNDLSLEFSLSQIDKIHSALLVYKQSKTNDSLQPIKIIIKSIIINKRTNLALLYPKFHLLNESDLSFIDNIPLSPQLVKSVFSKINLNKEIIFSENNNGIIGVNSLKEKLMFGGELPIEKTKKVKNNFVILSNLFTAIDNEIAKMLNKQIMESLNSFNKKQFHQWANSYLSQVTVCSLSLIFTNEITQVLTNLSNHKKQSITQKNEYDMISEKYMQWIKTKDKIIEQSHMNIMLTIINHLNIIDSLMKSNTNNIESFEWLKYLRHLWDQSKKEVIIECGGWSNYQLKNFISHERILLTPETDKVFLFTSSCFREKSASVVKISNNSFSYKEIFNEYAGLFWADMLSINIINIDNLAKVKTVFDIATINKSWIFLDNIDILDNGKGINYLVYLSKFMQVIQQEVILNDIKCNTSERMFCLMGCINLTERTKFKENALKSSSRVMNFIKPDPEFYYKNILRFFGTKLIKKDMNKVIALVQKRESNCKLIKEHYYNDFEFFNALMRFVLSKENSLLTESHLVSFVNNYTKEKHEPLLIKSSDLANDSSQIQAITSSNKIQAYCEENEVLYDQELLNGLRYLIEYILQSDHDSYKQIPIIVGYGKTHFIQLFFSYINYMSYKKKIYHNIIHQHSLQQFYSDYILRTGSSNSTPISYSSNQTKGENQSITIIKLLFWEKEISYIKKEKLLITLKDSNELNLSEIDTSIFKIIRLPKLKTKKLLMLFIVKMNKALSAMNIILSDEYSLALSKYIKAIIENQNKEEERFAYSLHEFSNWIFKLLEYCSNHKIALNTKILFNLIIQALLITFPQNEEFINCLQSTGIQLFNNHDELSDFLSFYNQPNRKKWIKYDLKKKQFVSFTFEEYTKDMIDYIKTIVINANILIVTNDISVIDLLPNSIKINDMCFEQNVIDYDNSSFLKETASNSKKNSITTYVTSTSTTLYDNSMIGIYIISSLEKWKNKANIFDNYYKTFLYKNGEKNKTIPAYIKCNYAQTYMNIINLFKNKLNHDEEKYIYSLINPFNDQDTNMAYADIDYDMIFSIIFQQNKLFNVMINYESENQIKLFSLIRKYFNDYNIILLNELNTKNKVKGNTVFQSIGIKMNYSDQVPNNTCFIRFNENSLITFINYILKQKFNEAQSIYSIAKKGKINEFNELVHVSSNEPSMINHSSKLSKMLYDVFQYDEMTFNSHYTDPDLLCQLLDYLMQSTNDSHLYTSYFLKFNHLSSYSLCKLIMKYLKHGSFKPSYLSIVSFPLAIESYDHSIKYSNELTMIISHTLSNYSFLISQPELVNSQIFYLNYIHFHLPKKQSVITNTILEKIYLSVANHFLFALLLTFEIMVNNFEMSKTDLHYSINYLKANFIFHNNNSIKFKYDSTNNKDFIQSKGKDLINLYHSKTDGCLDDFVVLVEKALNANSKYFYTSNLNTIHKDIDKLLYYMTFIPEQSPSIFKYLINKYLRPLYSIDKFKVNSFLKKKSKAPITIKADSCINITNFLCSLAAYYEIQFIVIRTLCFDTSNLDLGYKYIVDSNILATITDAMVKGYWLFISTEVDIMQFLKIADLIFCSSNSIIPNGKFKLFFDQHLIKHECNDLITNHTLLLQIDNNNIDDLEAAHDMWVNVLEENILSESLMDETQKDFMDVNSNVKNNVSAISDKDFTDQEPIGEYSDLIFLGKI